MGAGRTGQNENIDHGIGIELIARVGDYVKEGDVWAILNCNAHCEAEMYLDEAITISDKPNKNPPSRLIKTITKDNLE